MKDQSIRKLTLEECRMLAKVMGFSDGALDEYEGRYAKIRLNSPKRINGRCHQTYMNENKEQAPGVRE